MATQVSEVNFNKMFAVTEKDFIYEDDLCVVFDDYRNPQAPVHFLVVPRKSVPRLTQTSDHDEKLLGRLLTVARRVAKMKNVKSGYRVVMNEGRHGGQTTDQFYVQVLAGKQMFWPFG